MFMPNLIHKLQQVWKDVDGVLTCDPKIHPVATPVPFLTFDEAAELAYFGAQVIFVLQLVINRFYLHWEKLLSIQLLMLV